MQQAEHKFSKFVGLATNSALSARQTPTTKPGPLTTAPRTCTFCGKRVELLDGLVPVCCAEASRYSIYGPQHE
jgi:hypothetical protein